MSQNYLYINYCYRLNLIEVPCCFFFLSFLQRSIKLSGFSLCVGVSANNVSVLKAWKTATFYLVQRSCRFLVILTCLSTTTFVSGNDALSVLHILWSDFQQQLCIW